MSDFLTIDETLIPTGGEGKREPLAEGAYNATCVAMVTGIGENFAKTAKEPKVKFVFAIEEDGNTYFLRTEFMRVSLYDGQNPSTMWKILSAWTGQKTAKDLIAKMGKFDMKFFLGKPIQIGVKINGTHNEISTFFAPKKGQSVLTVEEIPEFFVSGDKFTNENIKFITIEGAKIKPKKVKEGDVTVPNKPTVDTEAANTDDLPF